MVEKWKASMNNLLIFVGLLYRIGHFYPNFY